MKSWGSCVCVTLGRKFLNILQYSFCPRYFLERQNCRGDTRPFPPAGLFSKRQAGPGPGAPGGSPAQVQETGMARLGCQPVAWHGVPGSSFAWLCTAELCFPGEWAPLRRLLGHWRGAGAVWKTKSSVGRHRIPTIPEGKLGAQWRVLPARAGSITGTWPLLDTGLQLSALQIELGKVG